MSVPSTSNTTETYTTQGHAERILQKMWKRCQSEELCDVALIAGTEEKRIPAHRSVLSEASEYFNTMFTASLRESTSKVVKMLEVNSDVLQSLVEYCYMGQVVISEDIVVELLKTSHMLLLTDVVLACENFLAAQLHTSNCLEFALLAEHYNCELLLQKAREYCLENFMEFHRTDEFLRLNVEQLSQLLASDDLCVATEEDVFDGLMTWMQHDPSGREQYKVELMKLLRMPLLERSFLIERVRPICTSIESLRVHMEALEVNALSNSIMRNLQNLTKPRRLFQVWMGITARDESYTKMFINYYCQQRHKWRKWTQKLDYRGYLCAATMKNCLYIIGGEDSREITVNTVICIDLNTMTLREVAAMNESRNRCFSVALNGFLYVVGGYNGSNQFSSVEKWNPETNKWSKVASMSIDRSNVGGVVLNKKLYVVGGVCNAKTVSSAECYDPVEDVWQSIASMGEARQLPGITVANGLLYVVGGFLTKTAERYDPQTNKWTSICSLRDALFPDSSCATVNGKVVVTFANRFQEYDEVSDEWKELAGSILESICPLFSYSGKLLASEFDET